MKITTNWAKRFHFYFYFCCWCSAVKHGKHEAFPKRMGSIIKWALSYPRDTEYHPIKIFHLNFANCFGLLFHILDGYLKLCAAKSVRRACMYTVHCTMAIASHRQTNSVRFILSSVFFFEREKNEKENFLFLYIYIKSSVGFITMRYLRAAVAI